MPRDRATDERLKRGAANARPELEAGWQNWSALQLAQWLHKWIRHTVITEAGPVDGSSYDDLCKLVFEVTGVKKPRNVIHLDLE